MFMCRCVDVREHSYQQCGIHVDQLTGNTVLKRNDVWWMPAKLESAVCIVNCSTIVIEFIERNNVRSM